MASRIVAGVLELRLVTGEDVPITLSNTVTCLMAVHGCKLKQVVNIRVGMGEV
jgi:hypothetical protein